MTFSSYSQALSNAGFSPEQVSSLTNILLPALEAALDTAFNKRFGPLPQYKQPVTVPQPAQPSKQEQEKPCGAEKIAEKITASSSSVVMKKSRARLYQASSADLRRMRSYRQSTGNPRAGVFQPFAYSNTRPSASLLGYIRHAEEMEATGQG